MASPIWSFSGETVFRESIWYGFTEKWRTGAKAPLRNHDKQGLSFSWADHEMNKNKSDWVMLSSFDNDIEIWISSKEARMKLRRIWTIVVE
jgi:hypothetical protein